MPYIWPERRDIFDPYIENLQRKISSVGELNYVLTRLAAGTLPGACSYGKINQIIGVLECVRLELYRRLAAPYEDEKIAENGDVPEYQDPDA